MEILEQLAADAGAGRAQPRPAIARLRYTHDDMVDFIIANPQISQGAIAARYGFTEAWVSRIIASDAFQERLSARRHEVVDPALAASMEERFRALAIRSVEVLMKKLDSPAVSDEVAIKAAALGAKALGLGIAPPQAAPSASLEALAHRLVALGGISPQPQERIVHGEVIEGN